MSLIGWLKAKARVLRDDVGVLAIAMRDPRCPWYARAFVGLVVLYALSPIDLIPDAIKLYTQVGVKHEPLTLIPPQFETPMPALQAAVFPPTLKELPPPSLDLYDLDE